VDLSGKTALVTGASRGLGRGFAEGLAAAGASVALVSRSTEELDETKRLIEAAGGNAIAIAVDITGRASVERAVAQAERELGPLDVLVNNAGASDTEIPPWEADPDDWWHVLEVNLRGTFLVTRAVLPGMIARGRGRVVILSSEAGNNPEPNLSGYSTSKAALMHFAEALSKACVDHGVHVFAYHPGIVRTGMTDTLTKTPRTDGMGGRLRAAFEAGNDTSIPTAVAKFMVLAGGQADFLSGRFVRSRDIDPELLARAAEIEQGDLYRLRVLR
jgi:NAD(P)-dependent dehydrogenase (short-subunit alcohol dehydrogenase family)